ncbi:MAG: T9SS type A sorting domain-containing protein [Crocinitomicaceae bacterium]|nr:T9SS type A sorting domain-containing protein [Crocinitomicaceae bacterium]
MKKLLTIGLGLMFFSFANAQDIKAETSYFPGEVLIQLDDSKNIMDVINSLQFINDKISGLRASKEISKPVNIWLLSFDENVISHDEMIAALYTNEHVLVAQNNHKITMRATTPNDPSFASQWHHIDGSDNDIDSDLAWDITTGGTTPNGDEIVVCVIEDQGANWAHTDLAANHWVNIYEIPNNSIDDDGNGYVDDYDGWNTTANTDNIGTGGHGTNVSGMIGAKGNNSLAVAGINWDVKIMQVDMSSTLSEANVIAAYTYPLTMRQLYTSSGGTEGAFVVATNASWGIDNANPASYPLWCGFYNTLGQAGILNCGATANNNVNIDVVGDMPTGCSSPYMISVTATNSSDVRTFSGYGQTTIDLGAPGQSVVTTSSSSSTSAVTGTSFASPLTAGVIALMYSAPCSSLADLAMSDPQAAADVVRTALLDGTDPVANLTTETVTGGRLNAFNSLQLIISGCAPSCDVAGTALSDNANCDASCDGSVVITASGGSGSYTYDIGSGAQASNTFTGLCAGNYTVTINDGSCTETVDVAITDPSAIGGSTLVTDATSGSNGAIDLTPSGGTPGYTYDWSGPSSFTSSSQDISGLSAGMYSVTITDGNGCDYTISNIEVLTCDMISDAAGIDITCAGDCDGSITVNATGGTGTYTYDIGSGVQTSNVFSALCSGNYSVVIDDGDMCNQTVNVTLSAPSSIGGGTSVTDELSGNDGAIDLTVSGGTPGYTFEWTGPSGFTSSSEDLTGLVGGVYEVTITDNNGCEYVISNVLVGSSVGITETNSGISIYPNPAKSEFVLQLKDEKNVTLNLHDASGKIILTQSTNKTVTIDISKMASGVYVYTVKDEDGHLSTGKLVIE